jgi:hypothetical protein
VLCRILAERVEGAGEDPDEEEVFHALILCRLKN